ncbi:WW domain binding protein VOPP1 [Parasteatoda tepidariorum]|nr:vesicular, overexpressed in cancer, prosurvival protein 1 [Parasteatoda tepidariorum]
MPLLTKITLMKPQWTLVCSSLLCLIRTVKAKQCRYYFDNGDIKYFQCSIYEFCCGMSCCRSSAMTFYQMWYFWLMVFLTILFCSGGGWWYRIRNNDYTQTRGTQIMPQRVTIYSGPVRNQPYMSTSNNGVPMQSAVPYPPPMSSYPPPLSYPPPPPYSGPPPSYDVAVNPLASAPFPTQTQAFPARQG